MSSQNYQDKTPSLEQDSSKNNFLSVVKNSIFSRRKIFSIFSILICFFILGYFIYPKFWKSCREFFYRINISKEENKFRDALLKYIATSKEYYSQPEYDPGIKILFSSSIRFVEEQKNYSFLQEQENNKIFISYLNNLIKWSDFDVPSKKNLEDVLKIAIIYYQDNTFIVKEINLFVSNSETDLGKKKHQEITGKIWPFLSCLNPYKCPVCGEKSTTKMGYCADHLYKCKNFGQCQKRTNKEDSYCKDCADKLQKQLELLDNIKPNNPKLSKDSQEKNIPKITYKCLEESCKNRLETENSYCSEHQYKCSYKVADCQNRTSQENGYCHEHKYQCLNQEDICQVRCANLFCPKHDGILSASDFEKIYILEQPVDSYDISSNLKSIEIYSGNDVYKIEDKSRMKYEEKKFPYIPLPSYISGRLLNRFEIAGKNYYVTQRNLTYQDLENALEGQEEIQLWEDSKKIQLPLYTYYVLGQGNSIYCFAQENPLEFCIWKKINNEFVKCQFDKNFSSKVVGIHNFSDNSDEPDIFCYSEEEKKAYQIHILNEKNNTQGKIIYEYPLENIPDTAYPYKNWIVAFQKNEYSSVIWIKDEITIMYHCWKPTRKDENQDFKIIQNGVLIKKMPNFGTLAHIYLSKDNIKDQISETSPTKISAILYYITATERTFAKGDIFCQFNIKYKEK